jgi:protein involved in polysaccharide export with SLBB domain
MLRVLGSILMLATVIGQQPAERPALRLKPGDTVTVTTPYGGDFTLQSDGAVYGRGFRAVLEGKTIEQAQLELRQAMRPFVREGEVFLTIKEIKKEVVYVVGLGGGRGPVELQPDMSLRQVLASAELGDKPDRVEATLYRDGRQVAHAVVSELLDGTSKDQSLRPNDVVTLSPAPFVRVWVMGYVARPGEVTVPAGSDAFMALAAAGGLATNDPVVRDTATVSLRRGPQVTTCGVREAEKSMVLEAGDTIYVELPAAFRVSILGEVNQPGEYEMRGDKSLLSAVAMAGGPNEDGTLGTVLVFRRGEMFQVDATAASAQKTFPIESGDVVFIERNERTFYVLGEVAKGGVYPIKDGQTVRVTDALAMAGGLANRGTMRRVYLAHPGEDGKVEIKQFNLDDYLKFGDLESNPIVQPGDSLFFGQPKGVTLANIGQAVSAALLFQKFSKS